MKLFLYFSLFIILSFKNTYSSDFDETRTLKLVCSGTLQDLLFQTNEDYQMDLTIKFYKKKENNRIIFYETSSNNVSVLGSGPGGIFEDSYGFFAGPLNGYDLDRRTGKIIKGTAFDSIGRSGVWKNNRMNGTCSKQKTKF